MSLIEATNVPKFVQSRKASPKDVVKAGIALLSAIGLVEIVQHHTTFGAAIDESDE